MVTQRGDSDIEETRAAHRGQLREGRMRLEADPGKPGTTEQELPPGDPVTSDFSLLAAMPGLYQKEVAQTRFTMLEEMTVPRKNQHLQAIGALALPNADNATVFGYEHLGEARTPIVYWLGRGGWPLLVCSISRALVATAYATGDTP